MMSPPTFKAPPIPTPPVTTKAPLVLLLDVILFGRVTTDLSSSENVANMLAYILGEEILYNNDTYNLFTRFHNEYLSEDKRDLLISSLKGE